MLEKNVFETEFTGRRLVLETGELAQQASGSCLVRFGDTVVLATATVSPVPREGIEFFPLSVDFEEKLYSVGKIPGSYLRREGRPTEKAVLAGRVIDRQIRPLFPKDLRNDVYVDLLVLSVDQDCQPEIAGMIGASAALLLSGVPWKGPTAAVAVGYVDGQIVLNPDEAQRARSDLYLTVAGTKEKVVMIEAGAKEVPEDVVFDGILKGHEAVRGLIPFLERVRDAAGKPQMSYESAGVSEQMLHEVRDFAIDDVRAALNSEDKRVRERQLQPVYDKVFEQFAEEYPDAQQDLSACLYKLQKYVVRRWLLDEHRRVDGRGLDEIRPLSARVGLLPRAHGSGLFTRGQTQVLSVVTLGSMDDEQTLDGIDREEKKRYIHHYNMPSWTVGETRPSRGPGRREIGHGALAERALLPVLPSEEEFPYAIRVVSEVLSSNGSTSQGAVCGSTLALMDAGVPIKAPVAGISCGLVTEGDRFLTMVDIQGLEDFFGDMDFKVAGTHKGVTAIQMDIKIDGLTPEIIREALDKTHTARLHILDDVLLKAIPAPRKELSPFAPRMLTTQIDVEKIRDVIGSGGKVIQKICAECNCKIDVEEDGRVFIAAQNGEDGERALALINTIVKVPEVGAVFQGRVTRLMNFGAFVEIAPGREGLVHISKLDLKRVEKVEDVVQVGDVIPVKLMEIDAQGRLNFSRRDALREQLGLPPEPLEPRERRPRRDDRRPFAGSRPGGKPDGAGREPAREPLRGGASQQPADHPGPAGGREGDASPNSPRQDSGYHRGF